MGMLGWLSIIVVGVGVKLASMYAKAPLPIHPVDLNGRVMVVTGASAGIGKETARILAAWNATVRHPTRKM
jgi:5,10-methylene-tetrahydrofolate dehydrogenase/methenyl tetrahydrofolate cyclohydrolase